MTVALEAEAGLAMSDHVRPNAEIAPLLTVIRGGKNATCLRVVAFKKKAACVRDEPTLVQAMACVQK